MPTPSHKRYLADSVLTATPERLVTLLYDGLVSSLHVAAAAIASGDNFATSQALIRAQGIVLELQRSLRPDIWAGGPGLLSLYHYLYRRMLHANLKKDRGAVEECLKLVAPLQAAWHEAAARCGAERALEASAVGA